MPTTTAARGPIPLTFTPGGVTVRPEDAARYLRLVDRAAEFRRDAPERDLCRCETADHRSAFERDFLRPLRAWCERHADKVAACYVPFPRDGLWVYAVSRSTGRDEALWDRLFEFQRQLLSGPWMVLTAVISPQPADNLGGSWFNPNGALEVHADSQPAPREGREEPAVPGEDQPD